MYPTAYTLTVLVLTLLQYSFNKRHAKHACDVASMNGGGNDESVNRTQCSSSLERKELRQLDTRELIAFLRVYEEVAARNASDELAATANELGIVAIFDELLEHAGILMPYWEYRLELTLEAPRASALWSVPQFDEARTSDDAEWLTALINVANTIDEQDFYSGGDEADAFARLWRRRQAAMRALRRARGANVFWHLMLLASIETGRDQLEFNITRSDCFQVFGRFAHWTPANACAPTLGDGERCTSASDCFHRRCVRSRCEAPRLRPADAAASSPPLAVATSPQPSLASAPAAFTPHKATRTTSSSTSPPQLSTSSQTPTSSERQTPVASLAPSRHHVQPPPEMPLPTAAVFETTSTVLRLRTSAGVVAAATTMPTPAVVATNLAATIRPSTTPQASTVAPTAPITRAPLLTLANRSHADSMSARLAVTTEFLAKELSAPLSYTLAPRRHGGGERGGKRRGKGEKRQKSKLKTATTTATTVEPRHDDDASRGSTLSVSPHATNSPLETENYGTDTLDALLVYMPTPKMPVGTIQWSSRVPFRLAYFSISIIEGGLGRDRRLRDKGNRRAKGARIYARGIDMPQGYTQVTQGRQLRNSIGALARIIHPDDNGPFVEFKLRVENRYGAPCKQLCLDTQGRYRRCARRSIRLSAYKRFSDPMPFYDNEARAIEAQWSGKGYYRKRKPTHLLFKCD